MKRLLLGMLTVMMLVISGCGEVVVEPVIYPPSITLYPFTKDTVTEYIYGDIDFYAPDSDIYTMTVSVFDSGGYPAKPSITTSVNQPGVTQGTIPFRIDYFPLPSAAGAYTFSIYVTDFNGNTSNLAVGTFWVP